MAQLLLPVHVEIVYTLESYVRYFHFTMSSRGSRVHKIFRCLALGVAGLALIVNLFGMLAGNLRRCWFFFSLMVLLLGFYAYIYFVLPKQTFKKFPARSRAAQLFTFREEDFMVQINEAETNGEAGYATHRYENLEHIYETRDDIFLFISKQQAYILEKRSIREAPPDIFALFLSSRVAPDKFNRR